MQLYSVLSEISSRIQDTHSRIHSHLNVTRLVYDEKFQLWLKCENEQNTGSFKWRGALSKLSTIGPGQTIITASTGNHGLAVAKAAKLYDLQAKIFVPSHASKAKLDKIRHEGAELVLVDGNSLTAELEGKNFAAENKFPWVSPYNDID